MQSSQLITEHLNFLPTNQQIELPVIKAPGFRNKMKMLFKDLMCHDNIKIMLKFCQIKTPLLMHTLKNIY